MLIKETTISNVFNDPFRALKTEKDSILSTLELINGTVHKSMNIFVISHE